MRVMMVNTLYPPSQHGGQEIFVSLLAEGLAKTGEEVSVLTLHPGAEEAEQNVRGVRVVRLPLDNRYWPFDRVAEPAFLSKLVWHIRDTWNGRAMRRIARFLDRERPDVVHTHGLSGFSVQVWAAARKRKIRVVHTLHDFYLLCKNSALFANGRTCQRRCLVCRIVTEPRRLAAASGVDAVVSISEYVLNVHRQQRYFAGVRSDVIYNIVQFGTAAGETSAAREREFTFGYIGRLEAEKGVNILLAATTRLRGDWRLRLAGTGKPAYVAELKSQYPDARLEWLGYTDAEEFYKSIDLCIVPSVWPEPLGRIVIEAYAAGRPVICAASGGMQELAAFGKHTQTYPPEDMDALTRLMQAAIDDPGQQSTGGFRDDDARDIFSETHIVSRYKAIYSQSPDGEVMSGP